ncbi:MAG: glucose PTS transporter subunit IIA [Mycoplasmoidaceae bacterium]
MDTSNKMLSQLKTTFGKFKLQGKNKGGAQEFIAKLSKGLMLPISMLPMAGLFLGIGAAIVTGAGGNEGLVVFGNLLKIPGDVIFGALPVLFAIAIAIAFTKDAGPAALSALVGFLVFSGIQTALIQPVFGETGALVGYDLLYYVQGALGDFSKDAGLPTSLFGSVLGIFQLQSSVFGGFIVGFTVAFLYNKFKDIQLPAVIGFFSGIRFIPIVTFMAFFPITIAFLMLWPLIGILFNLIGGGLGSNMVGFNSFIFGYIERALVPFGLHHAFYSPLWYTSVGGSLDLSANAEVMIDGVLTQITNIGGTAVQTWQDVFDLLLGKGTYTGAISGDQILWTAVNQVAGAQVTLAGEANHVLSFNDFTFANGSSGINVGQYMQGKYPFMMFGLPAAALAMVFAAPMQNRKMAGSIVLSAGLTSFLTGITEPIEFTFLFLAPWLFWGVHAFFCALSFGLMNWVGLMFPETAPHVGMTFSGGAIDWIIYGAIQIPNGSNAWWALILGAAYAPIYFFMFSFFIRKFNIQTPGRGENTKLFTKADYKNKGKGSDQFDPTALRIINAYGGVDNIKNVDACITKLRIQVADQGDVDEKTLTSKLGAMGIIKPSKQSVYAIYGAKADYYKNKINDVIDKIKNDPSLKDSLFKNLDDDAVVVSDTNSHETSTAVVNVYAPVDCKVVSLKDVPDVTFKDKIVGDGVAIIPLKNDFSSIIDDGKLELVFDGGHAYSFLTDDGTQILMHIGIDSINLKEKDGTKAKTFTPKVKTGDHVDKTALISEVDIKKLKSLAKSNITPIVVLNESLKGRKVKVVAKDKEVKKGAIIFKVTP